MSVLELESIALRHPTGVSQHGKLVLSATGASWSGVDGTEVKVAKEDVRCLTWIPLHVDHHELALAMINGSVVQFTGLRGEDFDKIKEFSCLTVSGEFQEEQIATTGQNWGEIRVDGKVVAFSQEERKPIFRIMLPNVSTVQHTKDEVTFEFAADQMTSVDRNCDTLVGTSFHIPVDTQDFPELQDQTLIEEEQKDQTKKKSTKKKRKRKDKNAPKRGLSAYMFFSQDIRNSVRQEMPDISFGDVGKVTGERWRALSAEEKKKYQEMAERDKVRYIEQKALYDEKAAENEQGENDEN